ncbi:MAG: type II secretion system protein M [Nitrospinae bacterium]|nr:type II secretion system protein M [Nitrospinota bacterium]MBF0635217.1 type II secretion system protein M [Nitrospinota bacterium]
MKIFSLNNVSAREKTALAVAGFFVAATILWVGVYEPAVEKRSAMRKKIETKSVEVEESRALVRKISSIKAEMARFDSRLAGKPAGFSVITEMENLAQSSGARENVVSMTPQRPAELGGYRESGVELVIEKTTLPKLLRLLKAMRESQGLLRVKRMTIKPQYKDPSLLDVSLTVAGYEVAR